MSHVTNSRVKSQNRDNSKASETNLEFMTPWTARDHVTSWDTDHVTSVHYFDSPFGGGKYNVIRNCMIYMFSRHMFR